MKLNVSNIPIGTVYQFNDNSYILSVMLNQTRSGKYRLRESKKFTEVYQEMEDGRMALMASGDVVDNPNLYNYDMNFAIFDYDIGEDVNFEVTMPLVDVTQDVLYKISNDILIDNENKRRK